MANYGTRYRYDVFISFRGDDTRRGLIGYLRDKLQEKGIDSFVDDDNAHLPRGVNISVAISKAIKESKSSIIALSKNYATSTWCLDELVMILDCMKRNEQHVFPVFYHVDPSDVRHQRKSYGRAIAAHKKTLHGDPERVRRWESALSEICSLSGIRIDTSRDEINFINMIVEDVYRIMKLCPDYPGTMLEFRGYKHSGTFSKLRNIPECTNLKIHNIYGCVNLDHISELPSTIKKIDARYCFSLSRGTSSMLWLQVSKEIRGLEIVMPHTNIPEWFDFKGNGQNPHWWARGKFPIVALALVFQDVNDMARRSHEQLVELELVINYQRVSHKGYYKSRIAPNHVLVCDLRLLFSDEQWQGLDAFLQRDWNLVQVSYHSTMMLSCWGVFVYKQGNNMEDVTFRCPDPKYSVIPIISHPVVPPTDSKLERWRKEIDSLALDETFEGTLLEFQDSKDRLNYADKDFAVDQMHDLLGTLKKMSEDAKDVLEGKALSDNSALAWVLDTIQKDEPSNNDVGEASTSGHPHNPDGNDALIDSFCEITSSPREQAVFFLDSHNFDLDAAVSTFFDSINNITKRDENYPKPVKPRHLPFRGIGRTLGSSSSSSEAAGESTQTTTGASPNTAPVPAMGLVVDESQPVTSIQLRLADGTRMVSRFNHHHTIRDVRAFIDASRPGGVRSYQLQTMGFPPKQLADLDQTIEQAGIANSVIEGFKNSEEIQDLMSVIYLNGLRDGILEAPAILLALHMDSITPIFEENEEHVTDEAVKEENVTHKAADNENHGETIGIADSQSPTGPQIRESLINETSTMLWDQVSKEIPRFETVISQTEIPEWFDFRCNGGNPRFWARGKFPIVALGLVFQDVNEMARQSGRQLVELELIINGQRVPRKGYYNFIIAADDVLVCDLRLLFSDEEWLGLDAFLEHDWNLVQVSYGSTMTLSCWGILVYKQETNMEGVKFMCPDPKYSYIANISSTTVPPTANNAEIKPPMNVGEASASGHQGSSEVQSSKDPQQQEMMEIFYDGMLDGLLEAHRSFPALDIETIMSASLNKANGDEFSLLPVPKPEVENPESEGEGPSIKLKIYTEGIINGLHEAKLSFPTLDIQATLNTVLSRRAHKEPNEAPPMV